VPNKVKDFASSINVEDLSKNMWDALRYSVLWNASAFIMENDDKDPKQTGKYVTKGNVTEQGIFKMFMNAESAEKTIEIIKEKHEENVLCVV